MSEPSDGRMASYLAQALEVIDRHGWMVQGVFPTQPNTGQPAFCYTVGLTNLTHPELIVFSIDPNTAMVLLNDVGERIRAGETITEGRDDKVIRDLPVKWRRVLDPTEHLTLAITLYGPRMPDRPLPFGALQMVLPDTEGRFPDEPGYDWRFQPYI